MSKCWNVVKVTGLNMYFKITKFKKKDLSRMIWQKLYAFIVLVFYHSNMLLLTLFQTSLWSAIMINYRYWIFLGYCGFQHGRHKKVVVLENTQQQQWQHTQTECSWSDPLVIGVWLVGSGAGWEDRKGFFSVKRWVALEIFYIFVCIVLLWSLCLCGVPVYVVFCTKLMWL